MSIIKFIITFGIGFSLSAGITLWAIVLLQEKMAVGLEVVRGL